MATISSEIFKYSMIQKIINQNTIFLVEIIKMTWPHLGKAATLLVAAFRKSGPYFGPLLGDVARRFFFFVVVV